jgi:Dullard-like phosphatase family protein
LVVVLDLDECLIHTEFGDGNSSRTHQVQRGPGEHAVDGHVQSFLVPDIGKVNVRPHLAEFLEAVTGRYETYVFTAGTQSYADLVLDRLDPQGRLAGRLYRQHCIPDFGAFVKDLSILGSHRLHRTVLLDNNKKSFKANPLNGILIADFFDNPQDQALLPMLDVFRNLENVPDVRRVLAQRDKIPAVHRCSVSPSRPPKKYDSDLVVVLDLDECLIHTEFGDGDASRTHQVQRGPGENAAVDGHVQSFLLPTFGKINVRPHLAEFLEAVTGRYETYVFTAGTQSYADAVLDQLDPQGRLAGRLYRQNCVPDFGTYVKDLSILGKHRMHRTVLLDNNYNSFKANPLNGIPIATFFDNPQDRALLPMLDVFRNLENVPDVRTVLGHWFDVWNVLTVED